MTSALEAYRKVLAHRVTVEAGAESSPNTCLFYLCRTQKRSFYISGSLPEGTVLTARVSSFPTPVCLKPTGIALLSFICRGSTDKRTGNY